MQELIGLLYKNEAAFENDRVSDYDDLIVAVERLKSGGVRVRFGDWSEYSMLQTVPMLSPNVSAVYGRRREDRVQKSRRNAQRAVTENRRSRLTEAPEAVDLDDEIAAFARRVEAAKAARGLGPELEELTDAEVDDPSLLKYIHKNREPEEVISSGVKGKE